MAKALEVNARHCAELWGRSHPAVAVVDSWERLSVTAKRNIHPIAFTEGDGNGTLAEHWWDVMHRGPSARVFVTARSELRLGPHSLCESASHEIVESMIDPFVNLWSEVPGRPGVEMALEVADMTQDTYPVDVDGADWPVANFVTPDYFETRLYPEAERKAFLRGGGRFDYAGRMTFPGQILPTGYAIMRRPKDGGYTTYPVFGSSVKMAPDRLAAKAHPWARSAIRGCTFGLPRQPRCGHNAGHNQSEDNMAAKKKTETNMYREKMKKSGKADKDGFGKSGYFKDAADAAAVDRVKKAAKNKGK